MTSEYETDSGMSFRVSTFIGMATLPIDHSITSDELAQNALQALQHVQANRLTSVIAFSEIPK
jgi:GGDEF domain-containing protein